MVWLFGAPAQNPKTPKPIFFGIVEFKHYHHRYPKTPLLAYEVQWYGVWGATPEPKQYSSALCSSNTTIMGIQKHLWWPMGYSGMGAWGATPEPKQYSLAVCISSTTITGIQKHLCWPVGYNGRGVWGATPKTKKYCLALYNSNTTIIGIQKHLCWPMGYSGMAVWGASPKPQNPKTHIFRHCGVQTLPS